ncbi:hypothetical protein HPB52_009058 [Rhipicephalus sanguineus]|uniref:Uncharacterized protein n=1 Tax=Rhipicephalus sanguineus TaxID=34632 RepID=A0A9D4SYA9_RHISA|nr:hypothetical protein HPB52_009058 [Rhipicephalus sanguineus]
MDFSAQVKRAFGPPLTFVNVYRYPAYLSDEVLTNALAQCGKMKSITFATVSSRQNKLNGVRVVKIEMGRPVPNFAIIAGHRVMFDLPGHAPRVRDVGWSVTWSPPARPPSANDAAPSATILTDARRSTSGPAPPNPSAPVPYQASKCENLTPPPTFLSVRNYWHSDGSKERDDTSVATTPSTPPPPVVVLSSADDTSSSNTDGEQSASSGTGHSSAEPSRDSWPEPQSESEEQVVPEIAEPLDEDEHTPPHLESVNFPPLPHGNSRSANPDKTPIVSCGRYILPPDHAYVLPATDLGPSHMAPANSCLDSTLFDDKDAREEDSATRQIKELCQNLRRPDEDVTTALCREATLEELSGAIRCMPPNSAPGPDGLTAGFYATFLDTLGETLLALVNVFFKEQMKPPSFGEGRIVLLLKDAPPPPNEPSSWRPITLLNVDYKIVAAIPNANDPVLERDPPRGSALPKAVDAPSRLQVLSPKPAPPQKKVPSYWDGETEPEQHAGSGETAPPANQEESGASGDDTLTVSSDSDPSVPSDLETVSPQPSPATSPTTLSSAKDQTARVDDALGLVEGRPGRGGSTYHAKGLVKILRHLTLTDVWVHLNDDTFVPTRSSRITASRIDRAYVPDFLLPSVVSREVLALPDNLARKTDHVPLMATVTGSPGTRTSNTTWRLDPALLKDDTSRQNIENFLKETIRAAPSVTPGEWDRLKAAWKALLQEEGRARKRQITKEMNELLRRIRIIQDADSLTACTTDYLASLEWRFKRLLQDKTQRPGQAQGQLAETMDVDLRELSENSCMKITVATRPDGTTVDDPAEVEAIIRNYFKATFQEAEPGKAPPAKPFFRPVLESYLAPRHVDVDSRVPTGKQEDHACPWCCRLPRAALRPPVSGLPARRPLHQTGGSDDPGSRLKSRRHASLPLLPLPTQWFLPRLSRLPTSVQRKLHVTSHRLVTPPVLAALPPTSTR